MAKNDFKFLTQSEVKVRECVRYINEVLLKWTDRDTFYETYKLRKSRGERQKTELGEYYLLDIDRNTILWHHVNIEKLAADIEQLIRSRLGLAEPA
jgi:hypothetical protein